MSHREVQVIINCSPTAAAALEDQTNNAATVALMFQIGLWDFVSPLLSCVGDTEDCVCILCGNFSRHQKGSFDLTVTLSLLLLAPIQPLIITRVLHPSLMCFSLHCSVGMS